jgi:secondary thiamine-phosphate synthase enzyme
MKSRHETLSVESGQKQEMVNLTSQVSLAVASSGISNGFVGIYSQHTTAGVFVTEFQAALIEDIGQFLHRIVEEGLPYKHNSPQFSDCERRNAASHLRSLLLSHSVLLPVVDGKAVLGQFQSVILAELDGPRRRTLQLQILGE